MPPSMQERWNALRASLPWTPPAGPPPGFDEIAALYASPPRHYHTLGHIERSLAELDRVRQSVPEPLAVELALWFHDIVYDTRRPDNEERSAEVAADFLRRLGADGAMIARVKGAILATKHGGGADEPAAQWTADVDLKEGLVADSPAAFERLCAQIREEYAWVPAAIYAKTRADFLKKFLARDSIFLLEPYRAAFEREARANLAGEIARLERST